MVTSKVSFYPFAAHRELARVTPHCGTATFRIGHTTIVGAAEFLLPASGHAIIALHTEKDVASQDFGAGPRRRRYERQRVVSDRVPTCVRAAATLFRLSGRVQPCLSRERPGLHPLRRSTSYSQSHCSPEQLRLHRWRCSKHRTRWVHANRYASRAERGRPSRHRPASSRSSPSVTTSAGRDSSLSLARRIGLRGGTQRIRRCPDGLQHRCCRSFYLRGWPGVTIKVAMLNLLDAGGGLVRRVVPQPVTSRFRDNGIVADFTFHGCSSKPSTSTSG